MLIYSVAKLLECGLTLEQYARLTDWQLARLYGHERDDKGALVKPSAPAKQATTWETRKAALQRFMRTMGVKETERDGLLAKAQRAWEAQGGEGAR